ncbi:hypothetical protein N7532_008949 [Penicillium argentinense]|uniref:Transcription factor domain-containing protein n=1 Tax=Penicillium argentinense TaxID=1131581 RepID=A0A9W9EYP9_9EURO|nr:uncharacterized protein N7532_008949 [Penicillium argentinense]KAJ5090265.1 hypothetical protein N7532_008949 [Penicillium argentinense]
MNKPCIYPGRLPAGYHDLVNENFPAPEEYILPQGVETLQSTATMSLSFSTDAGLHVDPTLDSLAVDSLHSLSDWVENAPDTSLLSFFTTQGYWSQSDLVVAIPRARPLRPLSEIVASHLQFAIDNLKNTPKIMVLENQTPWCHQQLYKSYMPKVMQDAYACCSLYMSKNDINAPVIMSLFDARTRELLSMSEPTEPIEILARVHALILYQIMRLFDGDIRSHATADALFATLELSVLTLMSIIPVPNPSGPTELLPPSVEGTAIFWQIWVLQESARRTILLTFYFIQIYKVLQGKVPVTCDGKLGLEHSWYLSGHLWNSQSAFDFAVAWTEQQHHIVYNLNFEPVLQSAHPDEVDLFGRMLLVTVLGIDKAKAWFYTRGAIL